MIALSPPGGLAPRMSAYLLVAGSGFYLTQAVSISPIYVLVAASVVLAIVPAIEGRTAFARPMAPWHVLAVLAFQFVAHLYRLSPLNTAIGYALNFFALALAAIVLCQLTAGQLWACRKLLVWTTIALGSVEALVRFAFPFRDFPPELMQSMAATGTEFYTYKFNSIMYQDSNFVGMWLLTIFLFHLTSGRGARRLETAESVALFALLCLSVCRAAIFAAVIVAAFRFLWRPGWRWNGIVSAVGGALIAAGALVFFHTMAEDGSFQSKLLIFELATRGYLTYVRTDVLLFGAGIAGSADALGGIAAHNYFLMLLLECGVVGLAATLALHVFYVRRAPATRGLMVGFYAAGLSMAPLTAPYLYVALQLGLELARRGAAGEEA